MFLGSSLEVKTGVLVLNKLLTGDHIQHYLPSSTFTQLHLRLIYTNLDKPYFTGTSLLMEKGKNSHTHHRLWIRTLTHATTMLHFFSMYMALVKIV